MFFQPACIVAHTVALLPGDGIGPEIVDAVLHVVEATGVQITWDRHEAVGQAGVDACGEPLPAAVVASIRRHGVALKGPVTTPLRKGFRSVNVTLRRQLDLFANVRPCRTLQGVQSPFSDVDLIIFRENTEGLYSGIENYDARLEIADSIARITRHGSRRIIRFAFEYARKHGRRALTLVHKANVLKATTGMFLEEGQAMAAAYPDIAFNHRIIDNMAMQLVMAPQAYDCIVTTNLFGDILSDLCAGLVGGLGVVPGANLGDGCAVFEAVHGSAPDIAGGGVANPTALLRSAAMMLRYLGEGRAAAAVERGVRDLYAEGKHLTPDVGGTCTTSQVARRLAGCVRQNMEAA